MKSWQIPEFYYSTFNARINLHRVTNQSLKLHNLFAILFQTAAECSLLSVQTFIMGKRKKDRQQIFENTKMSKNAKQDGNSCKKFLAKYTCIS